MWVWALGMLRVAGGRLHMPDVRWITLALAVEELVRWSTRPALKNGARRSLSLRP
jgi:hypothetical protein